MKERVKAAGEIVEVRGVIKYDSECNPLVYYKAENGVPYKEEHLDFKDLTQGKVDVKEKSLPKDEPDYWEKLKHQYAGMAMQQMVNRVNQGYEYVYEETAIVALNFATALVNKLKEEDK